MDSQDKTSRPQCPGSQNASSSRLVTLRVKRERLREELRQASARLSEAEAKAERLARIEAKQRDRQEREQLGTLCKQIGLHRYRLPDASDTDTPAPLDVDFLGGALSWLAKRMTMMSEADRDIFREEGASLGREKPGKSDAQGKPDANPLGNGQGAMERPLAFDLPE